MTAINSVEPKPIGPSRPAVDGGTRVERPASPKPTNGPWRDQFDAYVAKLKAQPDLAPCVVAMTIETEHGLYRKAYAGGKKWVHEPKHFPLSSFSEPELAQLLSHSQVIAEVIDPSIALADVDRLDLDQHATQHEWIASELEAARVAFDRHVAASEAAEAALESARSAFHAAEHAFAVEAGSWKDVEEAKADVEKAETRARFARKACEPAEQALQDRKIELLDLELVAVADRCSPELARARMGERFNAVAERFTALCAELDGLEREARELSQAHDEARSLARQLVELDGPERELDGLPDLSVPGLLVWFHNRHPGMVPWERHALLRGIADLLAHHRRRHQ